MAPCGSVQLWVLEVVAQSENGTKAEWGPLVASYLSLKHGFSGSRNCTIGSLKAMQIPETVYKVCSCMLVEFLTHRYFMRYATFS